MFLPTQPLSCHFYLLQVTPYFIPLCQLKSDPRINNLFANVILIKEPITKVPKVTYRIHNSFQSLFFQLNIVSIGNSEFLNETEVTSEFICETLKCNVFKQFSSNAGS